ncbi:MAG: diguanylate cyclase [Sulfuricella sp.]|nr:diguanylate cyclase [Gammaproteobacteria bacterium]
MRASTSHGTTTHQDGLRVLKDLDTGILNHMAWLKKLHRPLICDEPPEPADLAEDAHCRCKFGRWYYQNCNHPELRVAPVFQKIGELHKAMHDDARILLRRKMTGQKIRLDEYERFMDDAISFEWEVQSLQFEIVQRICVIDHLTGVWNRQSMQSKLAEEMERMNRTGNTCCLCMMDIDHFKTVNDIYGHPAGDQVLQASVQFISQRLRKYDSIFRYGGEEFLISLPNTQAEEAEIILNRLRSEFEQHAIHLQDGSTVRITASFGVAAMHTEMSIQDAIVMADHALLCAKSNGRNRVCMWEVKEEVANQE